MKLIKMESDDKTEYFISQELLDRILSNCNEEGHFKIELKNITITTQEKNGITEIFLKEDHF